MTSLKMLGEVSLRTGMFEGRVERRLAAILAADVVGYSWLMGEEEEGTFPSAATSRWIDREH